MTEQVSRGLVRLMDVMVAAEVPAPMNFPMRRTKKVAGHPLPNAYLSPRGAEVTPIKDLGLPALHRGGPVGRQKKNLSEYVL